MFVASEYQKFFIKDFLNSAAGVINCVTLPDVSVGLSIVCGLVFLVRCVLIQPYSLIGCLPCISPRHYVDLPSNLPAYGYTASMHVCRKR